MNAGMNFRCSLLPAALIALGLATAPIAAQAQPKSAAGKPVSTPPPTGTEVGAAVDAMSATCGKASALSAQIKGTVARHKTSDAARMKSNLELKKKLNAVLAAQKQVERASKKAGSDATALADAARADYEAALAQAKTVEVETQAAQTAQDDLAKLVTEAEQASTSCSNYEATIRRAAAEARKAVTSAKLDAAKGRALARVPPPKALEASRGRQAKELEANKIATEGARTALEAMKAQAAEQPAATPSPGKPDHAGKPEHAGKPK